MDVERVRINTVVQGELAQFLIDLRRRGRVTSFTDAVIQALKLLEREELDTRLSRAPADSLEKRAA